MDDTLVTFPAGDTEAQAVVLAVEPHGDGTVAVILDRTPFHPVDHTWPDQPADRGVVAGAPVHDCVVGATPASEPATLTFGADIPARRGDPGWTWVVAHLLRAEDAMGVAVGSTVPAEVDRDLRSALSRGHSACHLAALALNAATAEYWDKDPGRRDSLGNPDLDSLAIIKSRIQPDASVDTYRLGKSVRRKGLRTADLVADLASVQERTNLILRGWLAVGGSARIETDGDQRLVARRRWVAELAVGRAEIPCGGTHVDQLAEVSRSEVTLAATDDGFRMDTRVGAAPTAG